MRWIFLSLGLITCTYSLAQDSVAVKNNIFTRTQTDVYNSGYTIIKTYERPFHWKKKQWLQLGGVIGISAAATLLDEPLYDFFNNNKTSTMDEVAKVGDFLGQPEHNYPFILAVWSSGVIANNDWLRDTGIMLFASVTTSGLIQTVSKSFVGRARPGTGEGPYKFKPLEGPAYHSFPSGHTMLALASSWILAKQINWLPGKIIFYSVPAVVAVSRIYDQAHWFSDIVLGSALGIACAEAVHKIYTNLKQKEKDKALSVIPSMNGLKLVYKF